MKTQIKETSERLKRLDDFLSSIQAIQLCSTKGGNMTIDVMQSSKFGKTKTFMVSLIHPDSWDIFIPASATIRTQETFDSLIEYLKK